MPVHLAELNHIQKDENEIADFPNTVGAIDGKHAKINSPSTDEISM